MKAECLPTQKGLKRVIYSDVFNIKFKGIKKYIIMTISFTAYIDLVDLGPKIYDHLYQ